MTHVCACLCIGFDGGCDVCGDCGWMELNTLRPYHRLGGEICGLVMVAVKMMVVMVVVIVVYPYPYPTQAGAKSLDILVELAVYHQNYYQGLDLEISRVTRHGIWIGVWVAWRDISWRRLLA